MYMTNKISSLKHFAVGVFSKSTLFLKNFWAGAFYGGVGYVKKFGSYCRDHRKQTIIGSSIIIVLLAGLSAYSIYTGGLFSDNEKNPTFAAIKKGELVARGQIGSKLNMGNLEITFIDKKEGSFRLLELDDQGKRKTKNYFGAEIMIFNTGYDQTERLLFSLTDEFGNQHERDMDIEFYLDVKDFGPAPEIYPRTIRGDERYLLFQAPSSDSKKLQLTVYSETTNKKVVLDVER